MTHWLAMLEEELVYQETGGVVLARIVEEHFVYAMMGVRADYLPEGSVIVHKTDNYDEVVLRLNRREDDPRGYFKLVAREDDIVVYLGHPDWRHRETMCWFFSMIGQWDHQVLPWAEWNECLRLFT